MEGEKTMARGKRQKVIGTKGVVKGEKTMARGKWQKVIGTKGVDKKA